MSNVSWLNDGFIQKALQYWNNANERFVLGHEYSHALLKHTTDNSDYLTDTVLLKSWMNEIQADSMSQEILNSIILSSKSDSDQVGWNKYLMMGGLFYLNILNVFENDQSLLNDDKELPALTQSDHDSIIAIFNNKNDLSSNLKRFSSLNRSFTKLDHPPTSIRIELLQKMIKKNMNEKYFPDDNLNYFEDMTLRLALRMLFALKEMDLQVKEGFHNAYLMRDFLNKTYNK
jgi:hypothetical protein